MLRTKRNAIAAQKIFIGLHTFRPCERTRQSATRRYSHPQWAEARAKDHYENFRSNEHAMLCVVVTSVKPMAWLADDE